MQHRFTLSSPVGEVWRALMDLPRMATCTPGAESVEAVAADRYRGTLHLGLGPIRLSLDGEVEFSERDDQAHRAVLAARGADARLGGGVRALITISIPPAPGEVREVVIDSDLRVLGRMGEIGQPLMQRKADEVMQVFVGNLAVSLGGAAVVQSAVGTPGRPIEGDSSGTAPRRRGTVRSRGGALRRAPKRLRTLIADLVRSRRHGKHRPTVLRTPEYRIDGRAKVTGSARYTADLVRDGMLHVAYVRSPYPHARIRAVDTTRAEQMPGVRAIMTGADVRPLHLGRRLQDWPLLAWDTVRFVGDRVAVIAADSVDQAEAAVPLVDIEYQEIPAVFDVDEALRRGAPVLHPDATAYEYLRGTRPPRDHPNIQGRAVHEHGDVDVAFASAARVFEHTFEVARVFQGALEPHAGLVWMEGERFHVVSTNKSPFRLREQLGASLGIPLDHLDIDSGYIGGDFGGKGSSIDEFILIVLARRTGRAVRAVTRFTDELRATNSRHAGRVTLRTGVDESGRIVAHEAWSRFDGGAYAAAKGNTNLVPGSSRMTLAGYHVPHARVESIAVYTNQIPGGHARAPGQPQVAFAGESHIDLMAREMGIDPIEFRRRNAIRPGEIDVLGRVWQQSEMPAVLDRLVREAKWERPAGDGIGRGVALGARGSPSGELTATVELSVGSDGCIEVLTGLPDQGGGADTMIQRVVAEELAVAPDRVRVRGGTTAEAPYDLGVGGSRVTPVVGGAAQQGAKLLRDRLESLARGETLEAQLRLAAARPDRASVVGEFEHPPGLFSTYAYGVEVSVDRGTGEVRVERCIFVADVGTVINPVALRGQLVGGFAHGLGQALMEELRVEDGVVTTANLGDYKMPVMADVPPLHIVLLTHAKGGGPFGAKSAGELANVTIAPAIANAIDDVTGVRVTSLPITAEKVYAGLTEWSGRVSRMQSSRLPPTTSPRIARRPDPPPLEAKDSGPISPPENLEFL